MAPPSASAEPFQSAERKKQQPSQRKSYADIAEEARYDAVLAKTKAAAANASNGFSSESTGNGRENFSAVPRTAPVLRIVDTHPEEVASRPRVERQESSHEYSATV